MVTIEKRVGREKAYVVFGPYTNPVTVLDETQCLLNNFANPDSTVAADLDGLFLFDKFLRDPSSQGIFRAIKMDQGRASPELKIHLAGRIFEEIVTYTIARDFCSAPPSIINQYS